MSGVPGFTMESNRKIPSRGSRSRQIRFVMVPFAYVTDVVKEELLSKAPSLGIMFDDFMSTISPPSANPRLETETRGDQPHVHEHEHG